MPAPEPVVRKRVPRTPTAPGAAAGAAASTETAAALPPADSADFEALAQALQAHPDYRVLRRLQPKLQWPASAGAQATVRVLILDTETTGLDASRERIIELALLRVDVDRQSGLPVGAVAVYDGLEDPGKPIPAEVVALTGITNAQVRGQQLDEACIAELLHGVDLVLAHNAGFDRPFVERRLPAFAELAWACSFADIDWKAQGRSSAKLESLARDLGLFYDAHRAEMDCHALLAVLAAPLPRGAQTGLARLLEAAQAPSWRLQATQAPFEARELLKQRGYRWNADQRVWHTRIQDADALEQECSWLREHVYGQRHASVQVEKLDASVRFSSRSGAVQQMPL